jgi:anti-sigma regulatory factor (Ser/Thr protein kinase)
MPADRGASTNGRTPSLEDGVAASSELDRLRVTCRRQAGTIDALGKAIATLRSGAGALEADNRELRAENQRVRHGPGAHPLVEAAAADTGRAEVRLALDASAPATARAIVADTLGARWAGPALERAQLATSELVTNAVVHSGASADALLVLRLQRSQHAVRLEVEDPGQGGAIAPRQADLAGGGGFGLNLVHHVSERWGFEHVAGEGTRVWADIELPPVSSVP